MVPLRPDACRRAALPGLRRRQPIDRVGHGPPECTRCPLTPPNAPVEISENRDRQLRSSVHGSPRTGSNPPSSAIQPSKYGDFCRVSGECPTRDRKPVPSSPSTPARWSGPFQRRVRTRSPTAAPHQGGTSGSATQVDQWSWARWKGRRGTPDRPSSAFTNPNGRPLRAAVQARQIRTLMPICG
jgi:hypothetical protein